MSSDSADLSARSEPLNAAFGERSSAQDGAASGAVPQPSPSFRELYDHYVGFVWRSAAHRGANCGEHLR